MLVTLCDTVVLATGHISSMSLIFGETNLRVEYSEVTESAGKMLSKLKGLVVTTNINININITVAVLLVVVCKILALFSA